MLRFHFNVYDGRSERDAEGVWLPDVEAARVMAVRHAGKIMRDEAHRIVFDEDWRMEVTDDTGPVLFMMTFQVIDAPFIATDR